MTLSIRLLGFPEIRLNDVHVSLPGYKPLALFSYLLLNPRPQSRQHLVEQLYDQAADPRASLRWSLSQLRKAVGSDYFLADRQTIGINWDTGFWLDTANFLEGQIDLYRGDFLQALEVRDGHRFMEWLYIQRGFFRNSYQKALIEQLNIFEKNGDYQAVVEKGHQLLQIDNLHEESYQILMRAYLRLGPEGCGH